ncbi:guanine deaminase [Roseateles amylovorans]|uniref:Guanine deaminase n=1 Tax=Roseateles amylovorans TaxID=2978473 RepID=A0ABY6B025_9BURK|nr:guanine deaminase [Roseateles amylovorans]UXH77511.1 guanine deaminase [Roseateles amylovorans]
MTSSSFPASASSSSASSALSRSAASAAPARLALKGDLLDFTAAPAWARVDDPAVRFRPGHWLLIEQGRIVGVQADDPGEGWQREDHSGRLILPGFVDTHVHSPQLDVIASYGTELLDWLNTYTFPAERRYQDPDVAQEGAARFLDALLAHGTTAAVVYPTVHKVSAEALFEAAAARGMRLITGKILMDRHAPDGLRDDVHQAERDCLDLIARHHRRERLAYAVTVRFAPTSTPEQLAMAGALCRADPTLYMQTHVAENRSEVDWVARLFPEARSYLDVYDRVGLLHPRAVLAHGIWLDETDRAVLARTGAQIAHCPSSNLFLGSGLFDWPAHLAAGVAVSVASDVGGGTSLSTQRTLSDGYKVQALKGQRMTAWCGLHAATRGAAEALDLSSELGHFDPGTLADVCIWDWASGPVAQGRMDLARDLHERVFAWMTLSDERNLVASYVAGVARFRRD